MGSDTHYPEESPVIECSVDAFCIARAPVTNREFAAFIAATNYVTLAEQPVDAIALGLADGASVGAGSLVFASTSGPVDLHDWRQWWRWSPGASWRKPEGPGSNIQARDDHPVVHVAYEDAEAYCAWARARLPTETEWEFVARGGLESATYAWGEEPQTKERSKQTHGKADSLTKMTGQTVGSARRLWIRFRPMVTASST